MVLLFIDMFFFIFYHKFALILFDCFIMKIRIELGDEDYFIDRMKGKKDEIVLKY